MDITKVPWWVFAGGSTFIIGFYNFFLAATKKVLPPNLGLSAKHIYICLVLTIAGLISLITLMFYYHKNPKLMNTVMNKHLIPQFYTVLIPGILLAMYMISNVLALSGGGGIAMCIINLNMLITIACSVLFLGNKINTKIIIAALVALVGFLFAAYESSQINK